MRPINYQNAVPLSDRTSIATYFTGPAVFLILNLFNFKSGIMCSYCPPIVLSNLADPEWLENHPNFPLSRAIKKYGVDSFAVVKVQDTKKDARVLQAAYRQGVKAVQPAYNVDKNKYLR